MDNKTLKFLKNYGFSLNGSCEGYAKIRNYLKNHYPKEYYLYVDIEVRKKAMNEANKLNENDFEDMKKYYRAWDKVFKQERKKLTKDILKNI